MPIKCMHKIIGLFVLILSTCSLSGCATSSSTLAATTQSSSSFKELFATSYDDFTNEVQDQYIVSLDDKPMTYIEFKDLVQAKWGIHKETRGPLWVEYDENYMARSIVHFLRGYVQVEALVADDSEKAKKDACANLQQQLLAANKHCQQYLGFSFLSGLDGPVTVTTMPNLPKEAFPDLYPVKKKTELVENTQQSHKPKPYVPKSYLEAMRARDIDPLAMTPKQAQKTYAVDSKNALAQYVPEAKKARPLHRKPIENAESVNIVNITASPDVDFQDTWKELQAKSVISIKIMLPVNYLKTAAAQYKDLVYAYSKRFSLAPHVVYGIVHTESLFNPFARSYSSAYGLMQLIPNSGGKDAYMYLYHVKRKPSPEYLCDPRNNIELGTAYFSKVKDVYFKGIISEQNAYIAAIAAYNTGIGNVAKAIVGEADLKLAVRVINTMTPQEFYDALQKYLKYDEPKNYLNYVMSRSAWYYDK